MTSIELTSITGVLPPYTVYACDVYGAFCIPIATISVGVPPPNTIILPPAFAFAPAVGIKISGETCNRFEVFFCQELFPTNVCLNYYLPLSVDVSFNLYYDFEIDENINGKPSWVGSVSGVTQTLYWDGSQWVIDPLGLSNPNENLYFGFWEENYILQNSYCPSICIIIYTPIFNFNYFLQFGADYLPLPVGYKPFYYYDDGIDEIIVEWNYLTNNWDLFVNSSLLATLSGLTSSDTPLGTWTLDPIAPPGSNITTVLECPEDFKQFQNGEYFYFMDGVQYNFQT